MKQSTTKQGLSDFLPYGNQQINYLVNCSKRHRFVYVETPKVACSTIKRVLQLIEVDGDEAQLCKQVHDRRRSPLASPLNIGVDPAELFTGERYFRFSFVRNPYTRILSAYLDKLVKNEWERARMLPQLGFAEDARISLLQFLEAIRDVPHIDKDIHWTPQSYLLQPRKIKYHYVGRFENFGPSFERVVQKIKPNADDSLFKLRADRHKTNASEKVGDFIGRKERDLILEIFEDDFEDFGYSMDPHFSVV